MTEVYNKLKKQIELAVNEKYLKGVKQGNLGFGNHTTLVVLQ